ncbi:putative tyrosine carboxypeptidase MATCAP2 [Ruditapes philippinarum]|uniref:putative tyrosine carboxypeptidase MATCAP2 n=1 Tax=Ruditapes philippinarum TaxID=129788 RepID=UPI00295BEE1F|nr:putative tyrosine carboxypeptidase MATCAP2 [Ruditapes philippinarum]
MFSMFMPNMPDKKVNQNRPPVYIQTMAGGSAKTANGKKRKKGKKLKFRKQFVSMASIVKIDNEEEMRFKNKNGYSTDRSDDNCTMQYIYRPIRQSQSEHALMSLTKLPQLPKPPTPTQSLSGLSCQSTTPRSAAGCRLPITLPSNLQPGAHERRKKLPILAAIKPENEKAERDRFMRANYNYNPLFVYRFPADSEVLERLGKPSDKYLNQAIHIMENSLQKYGTYENFEEKTGGKVLQRSSIMALIQKYLKRDELEREIQVNLSEDLLSRGSMTRTKGKPTLNVRVVDLREYWVEGLLRHEIGTHYLRSYNNKMQEWWNWKVRKELGMKPANPTEEGLASLHSVLLRKDPNLWRIALLYYVSYKSAFLSLKELFKDLGQFVSDPYVRWDYCIRAKRGQGDTSTPGGFCKDQVYLEGALQILKNRKNIDFHLLVQLGKISWEDIDKVALLGNLDDTKIPFFMQDLEAYHKYLDRICEANDLTDDILEDV